MKYLLFPLTAAAVLALSNCSSTPPAPPQNNPNGHESSTANKRVDMPSLNNSGPNRNYTDETSSNNGNNGSSDHR